MSQNIEVIRDQYAAVNERDWERAMSHYAEDVELEVPPGIRGGTFRGRDAVGEWFGDWFRTFDRDAHFEIRELREVGEDGVFVIASHTVRGRGSGIDLEEDVVWLYRLRDGKVTRVQGYESPAQALADVGPSD